MHGKGKVLSRDRKRKEGGFGRRIQPEFRKTTCLSIFKDQLSVYENLQRRIYGLDVKIVPGFASSCAVRTMGVRGERW